MTEFSKLSEEPAPKPEKKEEPAGGLAPPESEEENRE
jgi:hypothetical protein